MREKPKTLGLELELTRKDSNSKTREDFRVQRMHAELGTRNELGLELARATRALATPEDFAKAQELKLLPLSFLFLYPSRLPFFLSSSFFLPSFLLVFFGFPHSIGSSYRNVSMHSARSKSTHSCDSVSSIRKPMSSGPACAYFEFPCGLFNISANRMRVSGGLATQHGPPGSALAGELPRARVKAARLRYSSRAMAATAMARSPTWLGFCVSVVSVQTLRDTISFACELSSRHQAFWPRGSHA